MCWFFVFDFFEPNWCFHDFEISLWHWCCEDSIQQQHTTTTILYYCRNFISYFFPFFFLLSLNYFSIRDQQDSCNLFNPHQWICTTTTTTNLPSLLNRSNNNHINSSKHVQPLRIPLVHSYEKCKHTAEYYICLHISGMKKKLMHLSFFPLFIFFIAHIIILVPFPYHFFF